MVDKKRDFDEFVRRQRELSSQEVAPFDSKKELAFWLESLETLYSDMESFLRDYVQSGSISLQRQDMILREDFSGEYHAAQILIKIGSKQIKVVPIGTMLIGSRGRVDIIGDVNRSRLVLINAKLNNPRQMVQVRVIDPTRPPNQNRTPRDEIEWAWKFIGPHPSSTFVSFNKETFLNALLEVSGG